MIASLMVSFLFALVQGYAISTWLQEKGILSSNSLFVKLGIVLLLLAGLGMLVAFAFLISRHGLGNGFSLLIIAPFLPQVSKWGQDIFSSIQIGIHKHWPMGFLLLATLVFVSWASLKSSQSVYDNESSIHLYLLPISGIVPIAQVGTLLFSLHMGATFVVKRGLPLSIYPSLPLSVVCVVLLGIFYGWLFHLDRNVSVYAKNLQKSKVHSLRQAMIKSLFFLILIYVLMVYLKKIFPMIPNLLLFISTVAVVMDLLREWKMRLAYGSLSPIWPIHRLYTAGMIAEVLTQAKIPFLFRGLHHRTLWHFFAPYIVVDVMVSTAHEKKAGILVKAMLEEKEMEKREREA